MSAALFVGKCNQSFGIFLLQSTDNKYYKDSSYVPDLWAKEKKAHRKSVSGSSSHAVTFITGYFWELQSHL